MNSFHIGEEEGKLSLFADDKILYKETLKSPLTNSKLPLKVPGHKPKQ
jgi:hypothetical protein